MSKSAVGGRKGMKKIKKIINIEDTIGKHWDINRALEWNGLPRAENAANAESGIDMIERAVSTEEPYELLITDMHFPVNGVLDENAGMYVIEELKRRGISIPIIVCSSVRYNIPGIIGCIFYSKNNDLNWDLKELISKMR